MTQIRSRNIFAVCFLAASLSACGSMLGPPVNEGHERFEAQMRAKIGMFYDDPASFTGINTKGFVSSNILLNGHMENGYKHRGSCIYYFEIDPESRKIVGWRYEGTENDCSVN